MFNLTKFQKFFILKNVTSLPRLAKFYKGNQNSTFWGLALLTSPKMDHSTKMLSKMTFFFLSTCYLKYISDFFFLYCNFKICLTYSKPYKKIVKKLQKVR